MASERTKKARIMQIIFTVLHLVCLLGPFLYFLPAAFIAAKVVEKVALGLVTIVCLILAGISLLINVNHRAGLHRSILWILILAITTTFSAVKVFIYIMAIASILDELVFTKIADHYKTVKNTNKEIDRALSR